MPYHSGDQFRRSMHKDIIMASTGDVGRQKNTVLQAYMTLYQPRVTLRHCCAEFKVIGYDPVLRPVGCLSVALRCGL